MDLEIFFQLTKPVKIKSKLSFHENDPNKLCSRQGLEKGAILCFRNLYFYFRHGESTSTASQKSKDLNKVPLLLQDLESNFNKVNNMFCVKFVLFRGNWR